MKVFISWSGDMSREVAIALRDWIPAVLQSVEPYVSSEDIDKGARWASELARELDDCNFGIICVTSENRDAPWLAFEAGALSKSVQTSRVTPFLLDLRPTDISGPLAQFQAAAASLDDVTRLVRSMNAALPAPLPDDRLREAVEVWWPKLEQALDVIRQQGPATRTRARDQRDLIEEVLQRVRAIQRDSRFTQRPAPEPADNSAAKNFLAEVMGAMNASADTDFDGASLADSGDMTVFFRGDLSPTLARSIRGAAARRGIEVELVKRDPPGGEGPKDPSPLDLK